MSSTFLFEFRSLLRAPMFEDASLGFSRSLARWREKQKNVLIVSPSSFSVFDRTPLRER
jgi:hypothetical protein